MRSTGGLGPVGLREPYWPVARGSPYEIRSPAMCMVTWIRAAVLLTYLCFRARDRKNPYVFPMGSGRLYFHGACFFAEGFCPLCSLTVQIETTTLKIDGSDRVYYLPCLESTLLSSMRKGSPGHKIT